MNIQKSQFDTIILGRDVYKMTIQNASSTSDVESAIRNIRNGIVFCFVPANDDRHTILENLQFHLVSIRNSYRYTGDSILTNSPIPVEYSITPFDAMQHIAEEDIEKIAIVIGSVNRYYKDDRIPKEKSKEIYVQWIKNSLFNGFADRCFIAWHKGKAIGMCTLQIKNKQGHIDLFGIVPEHHDKKIGKNLLYHALEYLHAHVVGAISVVTAGENIRANIFFQKNNFVIESVELVYHKHIGFSD